MAAVATLPVAAGQEPTSPLFTCKLHIACDNSYLDGGYPLDLVAALGVRGMASFTVVHAMINPGSRVGAFAEHEVVWDQAASKLQIWLNNAGTLAQVGAGVDLSLFEFDLV